MTDPAADTSFSPNQDTAPDHGAAQVVIFSPWGLLVVFATLILAAWFHQWALTVLTSALLATGGVSYLWSKLALLRLGYSRSLSEYRCFPGETIQARYTVENRKLLPLPWMEIRDTIPFWSEKEENGRLPHSGLDPLPLIFNGALLWYRKAQWNAPLKAARRGFYPIGPSTLTTGDIFGFFPRSRVFDDKDYLVVYPRLYGLDELGLPSRFPLGESKAATPLFEDPTQTIGLREYVPGAPFRHIHWKASARRQSLQIKVFEPSTTLQVSLFLDVDRFVSGAGALDGETYEMAISVAASLANHLIHRRTAVGLFVNAKQADGAGPVLTPPASGVDHLALILERLAKVTATRSEQFEKFFDTAFARSLSQGSTLLIVTAGLTAAMAERLRELRRKGSKIVIYGVDPESDAKEGFGALGRLVSSIPVWDESGSVSVDRW